MKRITFFVLAVGLLMALSPKEAKSQYFYTLIVRTFADIRGKAVIGDSLRVQNGVQINGGSLKLAASICDTAAFTTTAVRLAISIPGALITDKYIVTERHVYTGAEVLPVAGNLLSYMAKPDTLLILRAAGTLSGEKVSWMRIPSN